MAINLGVQEAYCTVAEADAYLVNDTDWQAATTEDKETALLDGRYYIDVTFSCNLSTYDEIPDELKYANALLGADYIRDDTIFDAGDRVIEKEVAAGDVSSRKKFSSPSYSKPPSLNTVRGVLKGVCTYNGISVPLVRA